MPWQGVLFVFATARYKNEMVLDFIREAVKVCHDVEKVYHLAAVAREHLKTVYTGNC